MLVFSVHADTNFRSHQLQRADDGTIYGHLDNFIGVHCVMAAFFSGRIDSDFVRIELTYGEEKGLVGAMEVAESLETEDTVIVVDVTATPTEAELVVEKCYRRPLQLFLKDALDGVSVDIYDDSPDPVSSNDETDVYVQHSYFTAFLGIPCWGGDYNEGPVYSHQRHIDACIEAICRIAEGYEGFCEEMEIEVR